jgi:hypothetical protein
MQPVHRLVHLFPSQCIARRSWPWGHIACLEQSHACVPPCRGTTQCERCPPSHAAPASLQARVADVWFLEADTPPSRCSRRGALLGAGTMQPLWCSRPPSAAKNHGSGKLLHLSRFATMLPRRPLHSVLLHAGVEASFRTVTFATCFWLKAIHHIHNPGRDCICQRTEGGTVTYACAKTAKGRYS